ncbi:Putative zinc-or iron-chelating domain-containing protein [Gracilibacillus ureilyticus]|uniref:Putative zinc-or iron-chelating domain-containing protein n=1 Tax=Gracilibacillus ureilyticus TaxID=531814 RepID=A0A1H9LJ26_9BACI|nr:YkgJ family cysteine cluster protein [Gracilibacillus ureilyticus]SER11207.1 Putative zinc-or iron-chelating domain-containing protein [Gracilibacillus ureilyticus]
MEQYLTLEEIKTRCMELSERYVIEEDKFYDLVEHYTMTDLPIDQKLLASYKGLLELINGEINSMEKLMDVKPSCQMGCAFCCYFPIIINELEAKLMKASIEEMPLERQEEIDHHIRNYYKKYKRVLLQLKNIEKEDDSFKFEYRKNNLPCVMLNTETNQCLAYEIRPLPCRTYVNYANPTVCQDKLMPEEPVSFEFLYEQYMGALNEFLQSLYEEGDSGFVKYPDDMYREKYLFEWLIK